MNLVLNIKSEEYSDTSGSLLLLDAGKVHCCFGKIKKDSKELTELVYYTSANEHENLLAGVFEKHPELSQSYSGSAISYSVPESILFPASSYRYEDAPIHLQAVYGLKGKSNILSEHLPELNIYNTYMVPQIIQDMFARKFATGNYWHKYSVFLKNLPTSAADTLIVDFNTDEITVVAVKAGHLQLIQTFHYTSPEDVLYYLLKTCKQFSLSQKEVQVELSGLIEKDSAIYRELYKYFLCLEFAGLPDGIKLTSSFSVFPPHYFNFISKLATCVL